MQTDEIWKQITQFPLYEVSSHGRVRRIGKSRCLSPREEVRATRNIVRVLLSNKKVGRKNASVSVKALVVMTFKPSEYAGISTAIKNLDGDIKNNRLENLQPYPRNIAAIEMVRRTNPRKGIILSPRKVRSIRAELRSGSRTQRSIAREFKVCPSSISLIKLNKQWAHVE